MLDKILVIGGCRSGKSSHALELAEKISGKRIFLATCIPYDDEMKKRVSNHQQVRSRDWITIESPVGLSKAILKHAATSSVVLVDCLTLWINNLMMKNISQEEMVQEVRQLTCSIQDAPCSVILVSNEVGSGIVPENPLARAFRDSAGLVNQKVAAVANKVIWMVAGIPVVIKG
ncbi:MAG: bifunctional adenosylcobinamide kinase/adenosylcobinamide-phosphate guanylyltransferase [Desulfobacterium sp.]|nr:bifunctional adenosylcobinamide kinase/adenosylcobinamide-phosphate guanylyltransferase [Desulfobacterium sp.]